MQTSQFAKEMTQFVLSSQRYMEHLRQFDPVRINGKVTQVIGLMVESEERNMKLLLQI